MTESPDSTDARFPMTDADAPRWTVAADRLLLRAMRETKLLGVATPIDADVERERLARAFTSGQVAWPRWSYRPLEGAGALAGALEALARELEGETSPLGLAYAARARELAREAAMAGAVGTPALGGLARARFTSGPEAAAVASELSRAWLEEPREAAPSPAPAEVSDSDAPGSLLSRMRQEIGRRRLPFSVVAQRSLLPLAATGERTIWIAAGRPVSHEDVERTVLHEIEGHARPRARAARRSLGLFAVGTARGSDDQEGFALVLEERHGFLRGARRRELALRHRVVEEMDAGASFVDVVAILMRDHGVTASRAVAVAERAFRGGDGRAPGLGRERVYLASFVRVSAHLAAQPDAERVLGSGQVALEALPLLTPLCVD